MTSSTRASVRVRNRVGWRQHLSRFQGSTVQFDLRPFDEAMDAITCVEPELAVLSDAAVTERAQQLRRRVEAGLARREARPELFALAREAARRALGLRPFDEQVLAALALDDGAVVEMQTGEGKTLAAVMPAALNALAGRGVHVLTVNDYLARRDAEWMGPVYRLLGLTAAFVEQPMSAVDRRRAYAADVTYATAKEAGFDYLRDMLAMSTAGIVHRPLHLAIVDEADSLLIDEARVPLVIAGSVASERLSGRRLADLVAQLTPQVHFRGDEYGRDVELTDSGIDVLEAALGCGPLHAERNYALLSEVNCALHAHALLRRDVDYLVRDGRIEIVDEFTGRTVADRHWPDGLQAALEAKEGIERGSDGRVIGSITMRHFMRLYPRLCGMTGTAQPAAPEFAESYDLHVVVVPTHEPMIRVDHPDEVFTDREAKERAVVAEVQQVHATGRPVLVGTLTVEESERLAAQLAATGIACRVLNARQDAAEAAIVAGAGALGAVTIATNMAGRGTDIRLGGTNEADHDRVAALGGLYVIGTNRHESLRVDLQLRGRAGRQGDPGDSRFFVSLDDDLLVRYGIRSLIPAAAMPQRSAAAIDNPIVRREIARAQRIVEAQNFEIRRTLHRYAEAVERQRQAVMTRRQALLTGADAPDIWERGGDRYAALVAAAGASAVHDAERAVTLACIDRAWRDHLSLCADLREGIHLVSLGGRDPLRHFTDTVTAAFARLEDAVEDGVRAALTRARPTAGGIDGLGDDVKGPAATWTYIINDDPFRNQIGMLLTGPGRTSVAIYSALFLGPLLVLWALVDAHVRRRLRRSGDVADSSRKNR